MVITESELYSHLGTMDVYTPEQVSMAVDAANRIVKEYCGRDFVQAEYHEWRSGNGGNLWVDNPPIASLIRVTNAVSAAVDITNTSNDAHAFSVSVTAGGEINLNVIGSTNASASTLTLSTYASMSALETAIEALGKGWAVAVINDGIPASIRPGAEMTTDGTRVMRLFGPSGVTDAEAEGGKLLGFWPRGTRNIYINYIGGYDPVPADVKMAALSIAKDILTDTERDGTIAKERIGDYSYEIAQATDVTRSRIERLAPYVRIHYK